MKFDFILLPMMVGTYVLNLMDKAAISEASVFGIIQADKLGGNKYNWASSIFYLGYLIWQYPSSILMQKLPIGYYFGAMIILWGITTTTTAATTSFATLCVNRVFLGVFEACMAPILTILVGQYWTRSEHPLRSACWWAGSPIGAFIADAITYGVSDKALAHSKYETWQIVYFVFGPITICWGVMIAFGVPTSPMKAWFLNDREKKVAVARLVADHQGVENRQYKLHQVKECLLDPQPWLLAFNALLQCLQGGGLLSFQKLVLTGMGYTSRQSTLMSMPGSAIQLTSVLFWQVFSSQNTRIYVMVICNIICLIGAVLVDQLPHTKANLRLGAFYVLYVNAVPFGLGMSLISSNIQGFTKKATAAFMMFLGYCFGQFSGPFLFKPSEAPTYPTAFRGFYCAVSFMILVELTLLTWIFYENHKRDRRAAAHPEEQHYSSDLLDLTDREHPGIRYIW
ncbi:hypothetical protein OIDMADRAFT_207984 [Oidiodendron maius Zn]|uniref:Major facilitator superfamily (MFS) profile domain-containing protein n=1 Tax=Oidiodendron maius (strain Zn) TaxID=913774 RepID=A0A0C3C4E6_OIDMZ|nr:hypothetical protein OIDMADRAFT_207984 [Oidiodendron maius Zn]